MNRCIKFALGLAALTSSPATAAFYFVPVIIWSSWESYGDRPFATWTSASSFTSNRILPVTAGGVIDGGFMFPNEVVRTVNDISANGDVFIRAGTMFAVAHSKEKTQYCTWRYGRNRDTPASSSMPVFVEARSPGGMMCADVDSRGQASNLHTALAYNLALFAESKNGAWNAATLSNVSGMNFEKVPSNLYYKNVAKLIVARIDGKKDRQKAACVNEAIVAVPRTGLAIINKGPCFNAIGDVIDAFGGKYKLNAFDGSQMTIEVISPFNSPEMKPRG